MQTLFNLLSVAVISGADGPTTSTVSGDLPLPAILVSAFAVIFVLYVYIAKAINSKKAPAEEAPAAPSQQPVVSAPAPAVYTGPQLINVEEKEAAVVMAVVSHKTGIPLNKLRFESIKLMED